MRKIRYLAAAAVLALGACAPVELPEAPVERAARCAAAASLAMSGPVERGPFEPVPFDQVNIVSHYILLGGVQADGSFDENAALEAMAGVEAQKAALLESRLAGATARQCRKAYPAVAAKGPFALPRRDLEATAGCYQLAVIMGDFYLEGGAGQSYVEAPDLNRLIFDMQRRFEAAPGNTALEGQGEVENLQRSGMSAAVTAGPPNLVLEACQERFATAAG